VLSRHQVLPAEENGFSTAPHQGARHGNQTILLISPAALTSRCTSKRSMQFITTDHIHLMYHRCEAYR
jgi:hypothetical protein